MLVHLQNTICQHFYENQVRYMIELVDMHTSDNDGKENKL
jgi:hypothetical protein